MNNDDLIAELRRTLHERAAGVRPSVGQLPDPETSDSKRSGESPYDRDPTGRLRILQAGGRRTTILAAAATLAAAAAIAAAVALSTSGPTHSKVTFATQQTATPNQNAAPPRATGPVSTPTTVARAPVPRGFEPLSVTFVSASLGWALGHYPCARPSCLSLAATTDGGSSWADVGAPNIAWTGAGAGNEFVPVTLRFADHLNGWITTSTQLWSTHDGGYDWSPVPNPSGSGSSILSLEASNGRAYLVAITSSSATEQVYSTPTGKDGWTPSPLRLALGAGPVPSAHLVLSGDTGWIVDVDRTTVGGARLVPGSGWQGWNPPCSTANGSALLAATSSQDLVTVCAEGVWGTPDSGTQANTDWMFRSADSGATFSPAGLVPAPTAQTYAVTAAPSQGQGGAVIVATSSGLIGSFDNGHTWAPVYPFASEGAYSGADFAGFTTAAQGIAILGTATATIMVMTRDGGHTWAPVSF